LSPLGAAAALASAACWAGATLLFERLSAVCPPLALNLAKGAVSLLYLGALLATVGGERVDLSALGLLAASGLVGITLGDTLYFVALRRLGSRLTVLMYMLGPVLTIVLSCAFVGDRLAGLRLVGVTLTLLGVLLVSWARGGSGNAESPERAVGILAVVGSAACLAFSVLVAKQALDRVPVVEATFVRVGVSVGALFLLGAARGDLTGGLAPFRRPPLLRLLLGAVVVLCAGFVLSLAALKWLDTSIATALNSTEPLLILPMTAVLLHQAITPREAVGAALGVGGIALILLG
jgi:drug/metabolite transporter (DMT)-like permease